MRTYFFSLPVKFYKERKGMSRRLGMWYNLPDEEEEMFYSIRTYNGNHYYWNIDSSGYCAI